jgi:hypothetical protein
MGDDASSKIDNWIVGLEGGPITPTGMICRAR